MANIETKTRKSYTEDGSSVITDIYVDGDLFQTKEEYFDSDGYLIYQYIHDKTPGQLLKDIKEKQDKPKRNKLNKQLEKNRRRGVM